MSASRIVKILGWSAKGFRCPDHTVSFQREDGGVYPITLLQMPNGTGKTTTLALLRAALSGSSSSLGNRENIRGFRKRGKGNHLGVFLLHILFNERRFTVELELDFEDGKAQFKTTFGSGSQHGFHAPVELQPFLKEAFVNFFVFDGELAERLLDRQKTDAQTAVTELFNLRLFLQIRQQVENYWEEQTEKRGAKQEKGLTQRRNKVLFLTQRLDNLQKKKQALMANLQHVEQDLERKQQRFQDSLAAQKDLRERVPEIRQQLEKARGDVKTASKDILMQARSPHALSVAFAAEMIALKGSLDRVKLPESTAREFFEELANEAQCICGRNLDDATRLALRERASKYLGSDDVALLNALKGAVAQAVEVHPEEANQYFTSATERLKTLMSREMEMETAFESIQAEGIANDPELERADAEITALKKEQSDLQQTLANYNSLDERQADDETYSIKVIARRLKIAEEKLAEATQTIELKRCRDVLKTILERAYTKARDGICQEICIDANKRIATLLPNNAIRIDRIDQGLVLVGQEGGSVGETLSVAYGFLSTLFNRTEHQLPFVVDSPAGPIDLRVRTQVAQLIPDLTRQFVAFTISSERDSFVPPLLQRAGADSVQLLTIFRKGDSSLDECARSQTDYQETDDGLRVNGLGFFEAFQLDAVE